MELITLTKVKCKIGYDGGLITWISAKPTDWTPEVNYHISWKMEKQYYAENFVLLVVQGFIDSFFLLHFTYVSDIVIAGLWKFLLCPATIRSENMSQQEQGETCYKPSHRTTNKHWEIRYRLNCHEERCNRKRIHTHFLKDRSCEMLEGQNYLDSMQETHRWSHTSSSKIWENWLQQSIKSKLRLVNRETITDTLSWSKIWRLEDPWWSKTSQGRHRIISWNMALICEVDHGIIEKSKSTSHRSERYEIAE